MVTGVAIAIAGCADGGTVETREVEQLVQTCVDLPAVADATLSLQQMTTNFGDRPTLRVGRFKESLLRFDLGAIPSGAAIDSATLKLYVSDSDRATQVFLHRVTAPWAESTVTFKSFKQKFDHHPAGSMSIIGEHVQKSVDLTNLTKSWFSGAKPNHGLLLWALSFRETVLVSREGGTAAQKPRLGVCYTTPDDACAASPCQNGGTCSNTSTAYQCACAPGYEGKDCEIDIDECESKPCLNGGKCEDGIAGYTCECEPGYEGPNCETNTDDCEAAPCLNGGVCTDALGGYTCTCPPGYEGPNCETQIDSCAGAPCQNGGTCTNGPLPGTYACACPAGYEGANCEINIDDCAADPCNNGGTCIDGVDSYTCSCPPDWGGATCDINLNLCSQAPCLNGGTCQNGFGTYTCSCQPGYGGANCEIDIDDCAADPCQNGGTCVDGVNSYSCSCPPGYEGPNCETDTNECAAAPCQNGGTCTDAVNAYTCSCAPGYTGPNCETNIDDCAAAPCQNGGTCVDGVEAYTCACPPGYTGPNCEIDIDECAGGPCQNGGSCTDGANGYTCTCVPGYGGANCETNIDECAPNPCQNGGTCTDGVNAYTCACPAGYTGPSCEIDIDDCAGSPCQNGGTCVDGVDSFTCQCTIDWVGTLCETNACEDDNPCTVDDNTPGGCTYAPDPSDAACRAATQSIDAGAFHTCAIREGGKVYCWGMSDGGRLGNGTTAVGYALTPVPVTGLTDAVALATGYEHACAVRATGQVVCWGPGTAGQLGNGSTAGSAVPTPVLGISDAVSVAAGRGHTCVLRGSGQIACFGLGTSGQLGQGAFASSLAPVKVIDDVDLVGPLGTPLPHAPLPWVAVTANEFFTCGLRASGQALCWGSNGNGQLGMGALGNRNQPAQVTNLVDAISIAAGRFHACAVRADSTVACWGASFGLGRTGADLLVLDLVGNPLSPFEGAIAVSASGFHTCVSTTAGRTWCWGQSQQGELGQVTPSALPVAISGPLVSTSTVATTSGFCHSCALVEGGALRCWGSQPGVDICRSQLGWGVTAGSLTPVAPLVPGP